MTVPTIRAPAKGGNGSDLREVAYVTGLPIPDGLLGDIRLAGERNDREARAEKFAGALGRGIADNPYKGARMREGLAVAAMLAGHSPRGDFADGLRQICAGKAWPDRKDERSARALAEARAEIDAARAEGRDVISCLSDIIERLGESDVDLDAEVPALVARAGLAGEKANVEVKYLLQAGRRCRDAREERMHRAYEAERDERRAERIARKKAGLPRFASYLINSATGRAVADEEFEAAEITRAEREIVEAAVKTGVGSIAEAKSKGADLGTMLVEVFTVGCCTRSCSLDVGVMIAAFAEAAGDLQLVGLFERTLAAGRTCSRSAETEAAFSRLLSAEGVPTPFSFAPEPAQARVEVAVPPAFVEPRVEPFAADVGSSPSTMGVDESVDPFDIATLPGVLGMTAQWMLANAYRPIPEFAVMSAIAFWATLCGRKYETPTGIGLNLYLIGLAGASFGKEDLIGLPQKLLLETGNHHLLGPGDVTSDSSIETTIRDRPCFLMAMDEIGVFLQGMNGRNAGGWEKRIRKIFLELYSKSHQTWTGKQRASSDRINAAEPLYCPTMNILGAAVEDGFYAGMDEQTCPTECSPALPLLRRRGALPATADAGR